MVRIGIALALVVLLAGCGSDTASLEGASTSPVTATATITETALLTDVDVDRGRRDRADHVHVRERDARIRRSLRRPSLFGPTARAAVVPLAGAAALRVRMEPALDADLTKDGAPLTYTGPTRIAPGGELVAEVARVGGFEAVLIWAIGVEERVPFRITTSTEPARLIVELEAS